MRHRLSVVAGVGALAFACGFFEVAAVAERKPVNEASYQLGKWLGTVPRTWAAEAAQEYLTDIREPDPIYARKGSAIPACCRG